MANKDGSLAFIIGIIVAILGGMGLLGALIFLLVGGIFSSVFPAVFGTPFEDLELDREAATCSGQITVVEPNPGLTVNNQSTVRVEYQYDTGDGPRLGEVIVVRSHALASAQQGRPVTVQYLPSNPSVSRIEGTKAALAGWAGAMGIGFAIAGGVATLFFVVVTLIGIIVALRARRRSRG